MERFTNDEGEKLSSVKAADAYRRLWEYEETGYTPEEINNLPKIQYAVKKNFESRGEYSR